MDILPLLSFFTGVISIFSPCILPVLPLFVGFSLNSESKSELISFICGFFSIFLVIIFLTGFFTSIVYGYIVYVRLISAVILLIIGFLMLIDYSFTFKSIRPWNNDGSIFSSFILGFLTSIAWAPCYSGYLISLISLLVSSNNPVYAVLNIVIYCIAFALTLLFLSLVISKINLEKLISKTSVISKLFALLIIISAVYLFLTSLTVIF